MTEYLDRDSTGIEESAKALQELSKTTDHGLQIIEKLGGFMSTIIGGPLKQSIGIIEDRIKYIRWERAIRLVDRANDFLASRGTNISRRRIPLNIAFPLFEAASLEENDSLQDLWARLLVNAVDIDSGVHVTRGLITILQDFGPLEAKILKSIYEAPPDAKKHGNVPTKGLPDGYLEPGPIETDPGLPSEEVQISLWNLMRLGCLSHGSTWDSLTEIRRVQITPLGKALVEACSEVQGGDQVTN